MKKSTNAAAAWSFSMMMLLAPTIPAQAAQTTQSTPSVIKMADVQKRVDNPDKRLQTRGQSNLFHEKHVEQKRNTSEK